MERANPLVTKCSISDMYRRKVVFSKSKLRCTKSCVYNCNFGKRQEDTSRNGYDFVNSSKDINFLKETWKV